MDRHADSEKGVGLIEALIAMLVLSVGAIGMAGMFLHGMQAATSSPNELIATQKAAEAIESVYSARDSHTITWDELKNMAYGGVFKNGAQPLLVAGKDGIVNTADDGEIEKVVTPGPDETMETADDQVQELVTFRREIKISDLPGRKDLRSLTVIITFQSGTMQQSYTVLTYISAFA